PTYDAEPFVALSNGMYAGTYLYPGPEMQQRLRYNIYNPQAQITFQHYIDEWPISPSQVHSSLTPLADGFFIVAWQDGGVIRVQTFAPTGSPDPNIVTILIPEGELVEAPVLSGLE